MSGYILSDIDCAGIPGFTETLKRFHADFWHIDYNAEMAATIVSHNSHAFTVYADVRTNRDFVGIFWTSFDQEGHKALQYETDADYSGTILAFKANPADRFRFTVTLSTSQGPKIYRLWPYTVDGDALKPVEPEGSTEGPGPGTTYSTDIIEHNEGAEGDWYVLDFDNIVLGFLFDGDTVDPRGIQKISLNLVGSNYGLGANARLGDVGAFTSEAVSTENVSHFEFVDVNPDVRLRAGDRLTFSFDVPDVSVETGPLGKQSISVATETLTRTVTVPPSWSGFGTGKLRVPLEKQVEAAWRGGPVTVECMPHASPTPQENLSFTVANISVTGSRTTIGKRAGGQAAHWLRMTTGFDDVYPITPRRHMDQCEALGYRDWLVVYIGMSHYFPATANWQNKNTGKLGVEVRDPELYNFFLLLDPDRDSTLNTPARRWFEALAQECAARGFKLVWSQSYEVLNRFCPPRWRQLNAIGEPALTGWDPPSSLLRPTNTEAMGYLQRLAVEGSDIMAAAGLTPHVQVGEPWWWDGSFTDSRPCIYDPDTIDAYPAETGKSVPEPFVDSVFADVPAGSDLEAFLSWLGDKLGDSTLAIRDATKAAHPSAQCSVLFFTPQILNPLSRVAQLINFPDTQWAHPAWDYVQIEDYDWLINGEFDLHATTFDAATVNLGYDRATEVHFFSGFVLNAEDRYIWPNIAQASLDSHNNGTAEDFVWAYPQVMRDGIIFNHAYAPPTAPQTPDLPSLRALPIEKLRAPVLRPLFFLLLEIDSGPVRMASPPFNVEWGGETWHGVGELGEIQGLQEGLGVRAHPLTLRLHGLPAEVLGELNQITERKARIYFGLADAGWQVEVTPREIFAGTIADARIEGAAVGAYAVQLDVASRFAEWGRARVFRYTDAEQKERHPGDRALEFMASLASQRLEWGGGGYTATELAETCDLTRTAQVNRVGTKRLTTT